MSRKLNELAYRKLIEEDLEWLDKQPRTLERQHIESIVRESTFFNYELVEFLEKLSGCYIGEENSKRLEKILEDLNGPHGD